MGKEQASKDVCFLCASVYEIMCVCACQANRALCWQSMSWRWWRSQSAVTCRNTIPVTAVVNFPPSQGSWSSSLPCAVALFVAGGSQHHGAEIRTRLLSTFTLYTNHFQCSTLFSIRLSPCLSICLCVCNAAAHSHKHAQTHKQCSGKMYSYNMCRWIIWSNQCISCLSYTHLMVLWTDVAILPGCACIWSFMTTVSMSEYTHTVEGICMEKSMCVCIL